MCANLYATALLQSEQVASKHEARAREAMEAAGRATALLARSTRDSAKGIRQTEEREQSLTEQMMSMGAQLLLREDAARAMQLSIDQLTSRCASAEQERDRLRVGAAVLQEQDASRAKTITELTNRMQQASLGAAVCEKGAAAAQAHAMQLHGRALRAEQAERALSQKADTLERECREAERKCHVLLQELAKTEGVRLAAQEEARARAAAEKHAGEMLEQLTRARSEVEAARSQLIHLQGCARALEGAGEEAAHARQLAVEKEAACQALQRKLDAAARKADAVRSMEQPLQQRLHVRACVRAHAPHLTRVRHPGTEQGAAPATAASCCRGCLACVSFSRTRTGKGRRVCEEGGAQRASEAGDKQSEAQ
jgi:chromosome segregation ATPase